MRRNGCGTKSSSHRLLTSVAFDSVCTDVEAYYADRLARYGAIPLGVDWSCLATQWLRFVQLLRICPSDRSFSLIDLGCGYGALATFLAQHYQSTNIDYLGIDLSLEMVRRGRRRHRGNPKVRFAVGRSVTQKADFVVASGTMNVMLNYPRRTWEGFISNILADMDRMSRLGFAVNFVTRPGRQSQSGQLYCTKVEKWARFCEQELGRSIEVLGNYGLQEFTLLARTPQPDQA
jgi:SAM-dependent methyltransferase